MEAEQQEQPLLFDDDPEDGLRRRQHADEDDEEDAEEEFQCRICLASDEPDTLIAPCNCKGSARWVHRACLDEWRAQERVPKAFTQCPTCKFEYVTRTVETPSNRQFYCMITRDFCKLFVVVQLSIGLLASFIHLCDSEEFVKKLYPPHWAAEHAAQHFSIGPYYVTAVILLLAVLGLVGAYLKLTGRMPQATHRGPRVRCCGPGGFCQNCASGQATCAPDTTFFCCDACSRCCFACGDGACAGAACDCSTTAFSGLTDVIAGSGEAGVICLPILLGLLAIFALIGVFVGFFFCTIVFQRIMQKHVHLLHMRTETQRVVVVDLSVDIESGSTSSSHPGAAGPSAPTCHNPMRGRSTCYAV